LQFIKTIPATETDAELVARYKSTGELEALAALYQRYMELLYGVCLKYFKQPEAAQDAVINIFEELVTKVKKHEIEHFKAWLYQLSKNHCLMALRKQKQGPQMVDAEFVHLGENMHLEDVMQKEDKLNRLQDCIGQLGNSQQQAVKLFYLDGKCYKEIAGVTGIDINQVKSNIQNGRRNLKICMDKKAMENIG
jgi:RNA polymerase sigma factor (sigma-70 family)